MGINWDAVIGALTNWDAITAIFTALLFFVAGYQIRALRVQQRGWETLKACNTYDLDPTLDQCLRNISKHRVGGKLKKDAQLNDVDVSTVLNYLEAVCIGINQGFYDEKIVRAHMGPILADHFDEFFSPRFEQRLNLRREDFPCGLSHAAKWRSAKT